MLQNKIEKNSDRLQVPLVTFLNRQARYTSKAHRKHIPICRIFHSRYGLSPADPKSLRIKPGCSSRIAAAWPLLYLTVAGSLGAYVLMSWLVNHWPVTRTAYVTVIVPVIALALGGVARHERLTAASFEGTALVLAGLLVGMRRPAGPAPG